MSVRTKSVRITDEAHRFLSGITNLNVSANLELILDMMQNYDAALPMILEYLKVNNDAVKCSSEGLELFNDYILVKKDKIKKLEYRISNKTYRDRNRITKEEEKEIPEHHVEIFKEIELTNRWTECGNLETDKQFEPWLADAMSNGIDEANKKYTNNEYD